MANNKNNKKGNGGKPRKQRNHADRLPVFIESACEFSDDPKCLDNAVWIVRAIQQESPDRFRELMEIRRHSPDRFREILDAERRSTNTEVNGAGNPGG